MILLALLMAACKKQPPQSSTSPLDTTVFSGTQSFTYTGHLPLQDKPIEVYYHIPESAHSTSPVLFAFHGAGREGEYSRNALVNKADDYGVILIAPTFSDQFYPGSDRYNLGNVFEDGDRPSSTTLNTPTEWTFAVIEPLFDYFTGQIGSEETSYDLYGHSAGGQFVHRLILLNSGLRFNRAVPAASGWYTVPDTAITFPYGIDEAPVDLLSLYELFGRRVHVLVGEDDDDPSSAGLRHNSQADAQGLNRVDRAIHFYNRSGEIASVAKQTFRWRFHLVPDVAHEYAGNGVFAMDLLYKK